MNLKTVKELFSKIIKSNWFKKDYIIIIFVSNWSIIFHLNSAKSVLLFLNTFTDSCPVEKENFQKQQNSENPFNAPWINSTVRTEIYIQFSRILNIFTSNTFSYFKAQNWIYLISPNKKLSSFSTFFFFVCTVKSLRLSTKNENSLLALCRESKMMNKRLQYEKKCSLHCSMVSRIAENSVYIYITPWKRNAKEEKNGKKIKK